MADVNDMESLMEDYHRQVAEAGEMTRRLRELSATAMSARRQVTATVGSQGEVLELTFPTDGWRTMAGKELTDLIVATIAQARADVGQQVAAVLAPSLPPSMDVEKLMAGEVDLADLFDPEAALAELGDHYSRSPRSDGGEGTTS